MLKKRTVLVLGAGASVPYGFPTGIQLSEKVVDQLQQGHEAFNELCKVGNSPDEIEKFRVAFHKSGKNSVDAFLEHRADLINIGKLAIAAVLIPYEREPALFTYHESWLRYLYNNMNSTFDEFNLNQLSIITFNYDRNIEHFFFNALKHSYNRSDDECVQALSGIPFIHLHGSLGTLPWQRKPLARPYDPVLRPDALLTCAKAIKIIHEDIRDGRDADFGRARELLADASRQIFMGFGFNKTNVERLGIATLPEEKGIATSYGLGEQEKYAIARLCGGKVSFVTDDCMTIVRERIAWD